jgi:ketosteroid isomerase-like protein
MSEENVEIVRRLYAATGQGKFGVPEFFDSNVRVRWLEGPGFGNETVGLEALGAALNVWLESYENATLTAERVIDAGGDQVVVLAVWDARGRTSGVATEWHHGSVVTVRDGRITSLVSYEEPSAALEAAGLSE